MKKVNKFILPILFLFNINFFGCNAQIENFYEKKKYFSRPFSLDRIKFEKTNYLIKNEEISSDEEFWGGTYYYSNAEEKKLKNFSKESFVNSVESLQKPKNMEIFDWACLLSHDLDRILYNEKIFMDEYKKKALLIAKELLATRAQKYLTWYSAKIHDEELDNWEYRNIFQILTAIRLNESFETFIDISELNFYESIRNSQLTSMILIADNIISSRGVLKILGGNYLKKLQNFILLNENNGPEMKFYTESIKKYFSKKDKKFEKKIKMAELYLSDYSKINNTSDEESLISPYIKNESNFPNIYQELYKKNLYFFYGVDYKVEYHNEINQNILSVINQKLCLNNQNEKKHIFFANKISNYLSGKSESGKFEISSILKKDTVFKKIYDPISQRIYFKDNFNYNEINKKISEMLFSKIYNYENYVHCQKHSELIIKELFNYSDNKLTKQTIKTSQDFYENYLTQEFIKKNYPDDFCNIFFKIENLTNFVMYENKNLEINNVADLLTTITSINKKDFLFECPKKIENNRVKEIVNEINDFYIENFNFGSISHSQLSAIILNFEEYKLVKEILNKNDNELILDIFKEINGEKTINEYKEAIIKQAPKLIFLKKIFQNSNEEEKFFEMLSFIDEIINNLNEKNLKTREKFAENLTSRLSSNENDNFEKFYERTLFIKKLLKNGFTCSHNMNFLELFLLAKSAISLFPGSNEEIINLNLTSNEKIDMFFNIIKRIKKENCLSCKNELINCTKTEIEKFDYLSKNEIESIIIRTLKLNLEELGIKKFKEIE